MEKKITMKLSGVPTLTCVASVSSRGSSRKLGQEQKKKMNDGGGGGEEGTSSPLPLPLQPFFCFRSTFRAIIRLETLATQAMLTRIWRSPLPRSTNEKLNAFLHRCILDCQIDFLGSRDIPPRLKTNLEESKKEDRNSIFICKCDVCEMYFSNKFKFEIHDCGNKLSVP